MNGSLHSRVAMILGLAIGVTVPAFAQENDSKPKQIREGTVLLALDCLLNRGNDWFAPTFAKDKLLRLRYAYWVPDPDFRQEDAVFVAAYEKDKLEGELVHVVVEKDHGKPVFYIVNNTHFTHKNRRYELDAPLGGRYTQGRLKLALKDMEKMRTLETYRQSVPKTEVECHFYDEESTAF